ncbi:uncharacterized protein LOC131073271 [Cryptomeria japonica]|uniref:uncharacterized protein LOC131073271 n=1 Tax=Cryptomeria japonica TaxID=3369 RepID=UPI0025AD5D2C|nr:uncharacterized protein LOC131073271 [Cryptomeria japonica]
MSSSGDISESGWTMYLDNSSINKSTTHFYINHMSSMRASSITFPGNEEESSMVSDASSGRQLLPLPDKDQEQPTSASYPARMIGLHGERKDLDCVSSCSCTDRSAAKYKLKMVQHGEEDEYCSWLQDTASSSDHSAEKGVLEGEVNMEEKQHQKPPAESHVDHEPHFQCSKVGVTGKV